MPPANSQPVVVGSGPAGIACASALVAKGIRPIVLDGGRQLQPERESAVARELVADPEEFDPILIAALKEAFPVDVDKVPLKPVYGSLFPYAVDEKHAPLRTSRFAAVPSLAVGGLSTAWGASMLPYTDRDHAQWPFGPKTLEPHYRAVLGFVPLAAEHDALEEAFPLYGEPRRLRATPQIASLLGDLRGHEDALRAAGLIGGRSRLAVWSDVNPHGRPCDYLGLCMVGCLRRAVYGAQQTLSELVRRGLVDHRPGMLVERFEERSNHVALHVLRLPEGAPDTLTASRVFVAAGPLATTRIALRSIEAFEQDLPLLDSAYYTFPLVRWSRGQRVASADDSGNVLAQVFLEIDDPETSPRSVHLQVYGYNDLMLRAVAARAHLSPRTATRVLQPLLGRLLYVQGYLHSSESPAARIMLERDGVLAIEGDTRDASAAVQRVLAKLRSLRRWLRFEPLSPMLQTWSPGKGFHVGGALPMRGRPGEFESDVLGRPFGLRRIHLADATVFPTLPATTITLPVMANAHRIGTLALEE